MAGLKGGSSHCFYHVYLLYMFCVYVFCSYWPFLFQGGLSHISLFSHKLPLCSCNV
jgi:hypothetical protein